MLKGCSGMPEGTICNGRDDFTAHASNEAAAEARATRGIAHHHHRHSISNRRSAREGCQSGGQDEDVQDEDDEATPEPRMQDDEDDFCSPIYPGD